jgi:hypothetical protein
MVLSYDSVKEKVGSDEQMYLICRPFQWPWQCAGAIQTALPNAACPGLLRKPWTPPLGNYLLRIAPVAARTTGKQTTINKYSYKAGHFNGHGGAPVQYRAYHPMEEVQGFTRSHWTPPSGNYYSQLHKKDMTTMVFFRYFSSSTC